MFLLKRPSRTEIQAFLDRQATARFSYPEVGATKTQAPQGYNIDSHQTCLGRGIAIFEKASAALARWAMFDVAGVDMCWPEIPIRAGANVAVLARHLAFWSLNACRVVYVLKEPDRFGFAYGTLRDHAEIGEERFMVRLDGDESVWYEIHAFSRPRAIARLAYPIGRIYQRRFAEGSLSAMARAVS